MSARGEFHNIKNLSSGIVRELAPGLIARIYTGDHAMLSVVIIEPHAKGPIHSHPEEQWGILLEGDGVRLQDGDEIFVSAGDFWRTPGGIPHGFRAGAAGARILDIFSPPRRELARVLW